MQIKREMQVSDFLHSASDICNLKKTSVKNAIFAFITLPCRVYDSFVFYIEINVT